MNRPARIFTTTAAVIALMATSVAGAGAAVAVTAQPKADRPIHQLVASETITRAQAHEVKAALRSSRPTDVPRVRDAVFNSLISDGLMTREQADAVLAADRPHKLHGLRQDGTLTDAQARSIREALKSERAERIDARTARRAAVLSSLVADGSITQSQADAVEAAIAAAKAARKQAGSQTPTGS